MFALAVVDVAEIGGSGRLVLDKNSSLLQHDFDLFSKVLEKY